MSTPWPDIVNGCYVLFGAPFILLSIIHLFKSKQVKGVSWICVAYFTSWGFWNMFYYPYLNQWFSFAGEISLTFMSLIYLAGLLYFTFKERNK